MLTWVFIILLMGLLLIFGGEFVEGNNLTPCIGMVISLICIGIGIRMSSLKRRGTKEKQIQKIRELEEKIKELTKPQA